jgi:acyl-CoA thioesterase-2
VTSPAEQPLHPTAAPSTFTELLALEELAADLFLAHSPVKGRQRVYGGQVVAQCLEAARRTITADHHVHSLHGYFIRSGDETKPIVLVVDRIRDGRSFSTRRVVAQQGGGAIFNLSASFQKHEPDAEFARSSDLFVDGVVQVPPPEQCEREEWDEISPVFMVPDRPDGRATSWCKIAIPERLPDDPWLHAIAMAYASDHIPMDSIRKGHPSTEDWEQFMGASLDHSVWFHRPARADEWLLFDMQLQSLQGSRGVAHGTVHTADGTLVATVAQEGLLRRMR